MNKREFEERLASRAYARLKHPLGLRTFVRTWQGRSQYVCLDHAGGLAYRLHLGLDCLPLVSNRPGGPGVEAESPWFEFIDSTEREDALDRCWEFFEVTGQRWLDDPSELTADQWREGYDILTRGAEYQPRRGKLPP